jgi:hypothetical protein
LADSTPQRRFPLALQTRCETARKVVQQVQQGVCAVVQVPRWGAGARFLDEVRWQLARAEPAWIGPTIRCSAMEGCKPEATWHHLLRRLQGRTKSLRHRVEVPNRVAFRNAALVVLESLRRVADTRCVVFFQDADLLSLEVLADLRVAWREMALRHPQGVDCAYVLSGSESSGWFGPMGPERGFQLGDYAEIELPVRRGRGGAAPEAHLIRLLGGIPELLQIVDPTCTAQDAAVWNHLGSTGAEIQQALDMVSAHPALLDRLNALRGGVPLQARQEVDQALIRLGLVRRLARPEGTMVTLRAALFAKQAS